MRVQKISASKLVVLALVALPLVLIAIAAFGVVFLGSVLIGLISGRKPSTPRFQVFTSGMGAFQRSPGRTPPGGDGFSEQIQEVEAEVIPIESARGKLAGPREP